VGVLTPGILPLLDGDGVVEPLPQQAVGDLCLIRLRHLEVIQGQDHRLPGGVEQRLPVGAVVDEELLVLIAAAEVVPQDRQHPVSGLDLAAQHAAQIGEPDEAPELLHLSPQKPDGLQHGVQRPIGQVPEEAGTVLQELGNEAVQVQFHLRHAGEKAPAQQGSGVGGDLPDLPVDPAGVTGVRHHLPGGK